MLCYGIDAHNSQLNCVAAHVEDRFAPAARFITRRLQTPQYSFASQSPLRLLQAPWGLRHLEIFRMRLREILGRVAQTFSVGAICVEDQLLPLRAHMQILKLRVEAVCHRVLG